VNFLRDAEVFSKIGAVRNENEVCGDANGLVQGWWAPGTWTGDVSGLVRGLQAPGMRTGDANGLVRGLRAPGTRTDMQPAKQIIVEASNDWSGAWDAGAYGR
jgi:hypothetical protein